MRKNEKLRPYLPDFVSAETLAYRLDCSVRSIQEYAKSGILPRPIMIGNLVRWRWTDTVQYVCLQNGSGIVEGSDDCVGAVDEYSAQIIKAFGKKGDN